MEGAKTKHRFEHRHPSESDNKKRKKKFVARTAGPDSPFVDIFFESTNHSEMSCLILHVQIPSLYRLYRLVSPCVICITLICRFALSL